MDNAAAAAVVAAAAAHAAEQVLVVAVTAADAPAEPAALLEAPPSALRAAVPCSRTCGTASASVASSPSRRHDRRSWIASERAAARRRPVLTISAASAGRLAAAVTVRPRHPERTGCGSSPDASAGPRPTSTAAVAARRPRRRRSPAASRWRSGRRAGRVAPRAAGRPRSPQMAPRPRPAGPSGRGAPRSAGYWVSGRCPLETPTRPRAPDEPRAAGERRARMATSRAAPQPWRLGVSGTAAPRSQSQSARPPAVHQRRAAVTAAAARPSASPG